MVSKSKDGQILSAALHLLGGRTVRGSSSRSGAAALLKMLKSSQDAPLAMAVDGPRGPAEVVKPGCNYLRDKTGRDAIALSVNSEKKWILKSWDKTVIPKPFSKVTIKISELEGDIESGLKLAEEALKT